jgi:hypothetical protein
MVRKSFEPSEIECEIGDSVLENSSLCEDYGR